MTNRQQRLWLGLLLLLGMTLLSNTAASAQAPTNEILRLVNQVRANYGLSPFQYNATLAIAAQNHANWMSSTALYSHTGAGGSTPQTRAQAVGYTGYVSENIVGGTDLTPQQGVIWWQNSAIHFNTMISPRYTQAGVGYATGQGQNFYVLVVGNPDNSPLASTQRNDAALNNTDGAAFVVAPIVLSGPREDGSIVHQVGPGQSIWAIAARYEVSIDNLLLYNNLKEDTIIQPGDELLIRLAEGQAPPPTPTPPAAHFVREGETAWTIAARYQVSLADLFWLNGLDEDAILQPGDEIRIRLLEGEAPPPTATPQLSHIVEQGDTLWGIAAGYNLTLDQLLTFNGLTESPMLHVGDELLIVPPTAVPTFTPMPPTATAVPTRHTPTDTPTPFTTRDPATPTPTFVPVFTPTPAAGGGDADTFFGLSAATLGLGLILLAGMVVVFIRREL